MPNDIFPYVFLKNLNEIDAQQFFPKKSGVSEILRNNVIITIKLDQSKLLKLYLNSNIVFCREARSGSF